MSTITDGTTTITPRLVLGVDASQQGQTIFHQIIGGGIVATIRPAAPRAGTMSLLFLNGEDAEVCRVLHAAAVGLLTFTDDEQPIRSMVYGVTSVSPVLDDQTRRRWTVDVGYQEVTG